MRGEVYTSLTKVLQLSLDKQFCKAFYERPSFISVCQSLVERVEDYRKKCRLAEEADETVSLVDELVRVVKSILELASVETSDLDEVGEERTKSSESSNYRASSVGTTVISAEEEYAAVMRPLQYVEVDSLQGFVTEQETSAPLTKATARRLAQEHLALSQSLPLSLSSMIWMRVGAERMDRMQFLISGPEDTPYHNGLFLFTVNCGSNYPASPPEVLIQTTGKGTVSFNPNLYDNGMVCLSLLGTWHGAENENWNPVTSTLLQVLVSIQSLILVPEPYYNEPGYESSYYEGNEESRSYTRMIRGHTARHAILDHLVEGIPGFEEVVAQHFKLKRTEITEELTKWKQEGEADGYSGEHFDLAIHKLSEMFS